MRKFYSALIILSYVFMLSACVSEQMPALTSDTLPGNTTQEIETTSGALSASTIENADKAEEETAAQQASPVDASIQNPEEAYRSKWDDLSEKAGTSIDMAYDVTGWLDDGTTEESDPISFLCNGMKHQNPVIRWYCANKIIDYYNKSNVKNALTSLHTLLADPDPNIQDAAALSLAIIEGPYMNKYIVKNHTGSKYAFMRFYGPRYNNGKVWLIDKGVLSCIVDSYCVGGFGWSPDDQWLYANPYGRIQSELVVVNVESRKEYNIGLFQYICDHSRKLGYKVGSNLRPDPWIKFLEWSPDSRKILMSYWFFDDDRIGQKAIAIYDIQKQSFDKVTPLGPSEGDYEVVERPKDFRWD